ncbi:MAG: Tetratricopeptide repeat protein [Marmoricola sp.]|nr:Tetratricopeptide repeat protein [Marmoricola sp.]
MLRHALVAEPESAVILRLLVRALIAQKRHALALPISRQAVAADPDDEQGHRLLAIVLIDWGNYKGAVTAAQEAVRLAPNNWQAHCVLGMAYRLGPKSRIPDGLKASREASRLAPHESDPHNLAGLLLKTMGRPVEAAQEYREAIRLNPENALAINNLAAMGIDQGRLGEASRLMSSALSLDPQHKVLHGNFDVILLRLIRRLYFALLIALVVVVVMGANNLDRPARIATVTGLFIVYAAASYSVTRNLPRGSHLWSRGLLGRVGWRGQATVTSFMVMTAAVVVLALLPARLEHGSVITGVLMVRLALVASVAFAGSRRRRQRNANLRSNSDWSQ